MYSDFQYRPPPPSYQASMQEYRLRLLLLDRQGLNGTGATAAGTGLAALTQLQQQQHLPSTAPGVTAANTAISPPPLYRAQLRYAYKMIRNFNPFKNI